MRRLIQCLAGYLAGLLLVIPLVGWIYGLDKGDIHTIASVWTSMSFIVSFIYVMEGLD